MLSSDLPIAKLEEDELNRGSFAESLAKTLVQYSFPSSLTIGLYGEWGSGKTSLLNMVFENVEQIDDGVVVLRFNPWLCSDSKQLVTQFFKQMATAIKLKNKKAEKVWELIDQYADVFDATSLIPVVGGGMVTDDVSLVKIIDECTSRGSVAVRIVAKTRTVDRDRLSEFVDLGEAYQRVKKFATENQFFDLPRDEQMSAVAFILIVERGPVESSLKDCIAEDAIMKALDQMGSKIETDDTKRD